MIETPYFDAYEKYKNSKVSFRMKKIYKTLSTGEIVLKDIKFYDTNNVIVYFDDNF